MTGLKIRRSQLLPHSMTPIRILRTQCARVVERRVKPCFLTTAQPCLERLMTACSALRRSEQCQRTSIRSATIPFSRDAPHRGSSSTRPALSDRAHRHLRRCSERTHHQSEMLSNRSEPGVSSNGGDGTERNLSVVNTKRGGSQHDHASSANQKPVRSHNKFGGWLRAAELTTSERMTRFELATLTLAT